VKVVLNRVSLVFLIIGSAMTGFWAYFASRWWYDTFPGFGMSWLPQLGPYNEHLAKDVGAMFIAFTVFSVIVLWRMRDELLVRVAGWGWLVFNVLHFIYHMTMLGMYKPSDQVVNVIVLSLLVIFSVILVVPDSRRRERVA
jgi:hypothetical protein